jgi:1-phosphofructokinase family hexose kinase
MILCVSPTPDDKRIYELGYFHEGAVLRAKAVHRRVSGKGMNAAQAIVAMGADTALLTFAGKEFAGILRTQLPAANLRIQIIETHSHTRCCTTVVNARGKVSTELVEEASPVTQMEVVRFLDAFRQLVPSAAVVVLAGTLPQNCPETLYADMCGICRERSIPVVIDAKGIPLLRSLNYHPSVVKVNCEELEQSVMSLPSDATPRSSPVEILLELGAESVVITDGKNEVRAMQRNGYETIFAPPVVDAVSAVGSGDAMSGGMAIALASGYSFREAVLFGMAMGSAHAKTLFLGQFERGDALQLFEQLKERYGP